MYPSSHGASNWIRNFIVFSPESPLSVPGTIRRFLGSLDGLFLLRDADLTTAMRSDNVGAASLDVDQEQAPQSTPRLRTTPNHPETVTAHDEATLALPEDANPDGSENRTRQVEVAAAQHNLIDEDWRAVHLGSWFEGLPKLPDSIARQLAQSGHNNTNFPYNQPDDPDKRNTSAKEVDDNSFDSPYIRPLAEL